MVVFGKNNLEQIVCLSVFNWRPKKTEVFKNFRHHYLPYQSKTKILQLLIFFFKKSRSSQRSFFIVCHSLDYGIIKKEFISDMQIRFPKSFQSESLEKKM